MIYAMVMEGDDVLVKIGKTTGLASEPHLVRSRLAQLQCGVPYRLMCIAVCDGYSSEEQALHYMFRAVRVRGEWFNRSAEVNTWIERHALETPIIHGKAAVVAAVEEARIKRVGPEPWAALRLEPDFGRRDPFRAAAGKQLIRYEKL